MSVLFDEMHKLLRLSDFVKVLDQLWNIVIFGLGATILGHLHRLHLLSDHLQIVQVLGTQLSQNSRHQIAHRLFLHVTADGEYIRRDRGLD